MRISSNTSHIFTKLVLCHPIQTSAYEEALTKLLDKAGSRDRGHVLKITSCETENDIVLQADIV